MNRRELIQNLTRLRLPHAAARLSSSLPFDEDRPFAEALADLLDLELSGRIGSKLSARHRQAHLAWDSAAIEDVRYKAERGLCKAMIDKLSQCRWIDRAEHLIITGETGRGKSWLASALAHGALRAGYKVMYRTVPELLSEWEQATAKGQQRRYMLRLDRTQLLVIDDWGVDELEPDDVRILRNILDQRWNRRSMAVVSPHGPEEWQAWLGGYVGDALVDRLVNAAHRIDLAGPSMRTQQAVALD